MNIIISLFIISIVGAAYASPFTKVDQDIAEYDLQINKMKNEFAIQPANPQSKLWVQNKVNHIFQIDQFMRRFWGTPFAHSYSASEKEEFDKQFSLKSAQLDLQNTSGLKELLKIYNWFKISEFGKQTDKQSWLLVQHADQDPDFQEKILRILESLWPKGETDASNYAYLFDRVAASFSDPSKRKLQRFGTQGSCVGAGLWEPLPMENSEKIDELRASVGLGSMQDYKNMFKDLCH